MERVWLSVPFLVLSTEMDSGGQIKKHLATPFGYIDLLFPTPSSGQHQRLPYVVTVTGDLDFLSCYESGPEEFKWSFASYVREIAESYLSGLGIPAEQLQIRFPDQAAEPRDRPSGPLLEIGSCDFYSAAASAKTTMQEIEK